jgi:hypothetical protein
VHLGKVAVEHDHVVHGEPRLLDRRSTVERDVDREPAVSQSVGDVFGEYRMVFDDEHAHPSILARSR